MTTPCVYILASKPNGTLYIGVTSNLVQRVWEHKNDFTEGFTKRYQVHDLVWYEVHDFMESAIGREKALKKWKPGIEDMLANGEDVPYRYVHERNCTVTPG